jgi:hypothetical protein
MLAMASMGILRLAMETWRQEGGKRPLAKYLKENFATLETAI